MADSWKKEIQLSGGNIHKDFINFQKVVDEWKLFEVIRCEYAVDVYGE